MSRRTNRKHKKNSIQDVSIGIIEIQFTPKIGPLRSTSLLKKELYSKLQRLGVTNPKILIFRVGEEIQPDLNLYLYVHYYDHFASPRRGGRGGGRGGGCGRRCLGHAVHIDRVNEEMLALNATVLYVNVKYNRSQGRRPIRRDRGRKGDRGVGRVEHKKRQSLRTVFNRVRIQSICKLTARVNTPRKFLFFWEDMNNVHNDPDGIFRNELHLLGVLIADLMEMREAAQPDEKLDFLHEFLF